MPDLSPQARETAQAIFSGTDKDHPPCPECGGVHARNCPRIASYRLVFNADGQTTEKEVTYWAPGTWEAGIIWAEDVSDNDASSGD